METSDHVAPLEVDLNAYLAANVLETFTKSLVIRYHHMDVAMVVVCSGVSVFTEAVSGLHCAVFLVAFGLKSIDVPCGVITSKKNTLHLFLFLM